MEQFALFRVIAAILHLGQVSTAVAGSSSSSSAHLTSHAALEKAAFLLGVTPDSLQNALLRPKVKAGREWVTQARSREQVVDELAALSKTLYEKNFGQLVDRINRSLGEGTLANPAGKKTFIGVLDIAGFEIFDTNGFEQLCINLTNEVRRDAPSSVGPVSPPMLTISSHFPSSRSCNSSSTTTCSSSSKKSMPARTSSGIMSISATSCSRRST